MVSIAQPIKTGQTTKPAQVFRPLLVVRFRKAQERRFTPEPTPITGFVGLT